jgi:hypothetical protein
MLIWVYSKCAKWLGKGKIKHDKGKNNLFVYSKFCTDYDENKY